MPPASSASASTRRLVEGRRRPRTCSMNLRVVDDAKRELAMGRDLAELRRRLGEAASLTLAQSQAGPRARGHHGVGLRRPAGARSRFRRGNQTLTGYPALVGRGRRECRHPPLRHARQGRRGASRRREAPARVRAEGAGEASSSAASAGFNALAMRLQAVDVRRQAAARTSSRPSSTAPSSARTTPPRTPKAFEDAEEARQGAAAGGDRGARRATLARDRRGELPGHGQPPSRSTASLGRVVHEVKAQRDRLVYPGLPRAHARGSASSTCPAT